MTLIHGLVMIVLLAAAWLSGASHRALGPDTWSDQPSAPHAITTSAGPLSLQIMNPALASLELAFEPMSDADNSSDDRQARPVRPGSSITAPVQRDPLIELANRSLAVDFDAITARATTPFVGIAARTDHSSDETNGWADGLARSVVPLPGLSWQTDWNSRFSLRVSQQAWRETTDVAVMGALSIDF